MYRTKKVDLFIYLFIGLPACLLAFPGQLSPFLNQGFGSSNKLYLYYIINTAANIANVSLCAG